MTNESSQSTVKPTIPTGTLRELELHEIQPSSNNPRMLFDPAPLATLKESIRQHGVLVPLTVYLPPGATIYRILDGERRYRCCAELAKEGIDLKVKANIVDTPDRLSGLLAMFSIHNYREGWELMPTALSLQDVMEELGEEKADNDRLKELTGLSIPQIERCRILMQLPEEFQMMSLDPDPTVRIPPNFWIEANPLLPIIEERLPILVDELGGRDGELRRLVEKYRVGAIRSVIHFRRVMEAFALPNDTDRDYEEKIDLATEKLEQWLKIVQLETRAAFDPLVAEDRQVRKAIDVCTSFTASLTRLKLEFAVDRDDVRRSLMEVRAYVDDLLDRLRGEDEPVGIFGAETLSD